MNTRTTTATIASLALFAAGAALAVSHAPDTTTVRALESEQKLVTGVIESVSPADESFVLILEASPESDSTRVTVKVNDDTVYTLNGKVSTMEEAIKQDRTAAARLEDGVATQVNVTTRDTLAV